MPKVVTQTFSDALALWFTSEIELVTNDNLIEMYVKLREEIEKRRIGL